MQPRVEYMLEKLNSLSSERLTEVEDFIDFLSQRDRDKHLRENYALASEDTFKNLWDNDDDAIYDTL